jgi:tetratricopeptide (TPR) repeat protein
LIVIAAACGGFAFAQTAPDAGYKLALADHKGQLKWSAPGFKVIQSSAKANGREIGMRGRDESGRITLLGFLFLVPEDAPLTSRKCRDGALAQEKQSRPGLKIVSTSEIARPGNLPVSLVTYTSPGRDGTAGYTVRGFVATEDICGDLEFDSTQPISAEDAGLKEIFSTCELDAAHTPDFADVVLYAQILYERQTYQSAASVLEKALAMVPENGAPFASAKIARRVVTDQAGMAYGIAGQIAEARAILGRGIAQDPDYPMYYYNLACADAGEKKLPDARLHLQQAFARKANLNPGETMPDPTKDDSFLPFRDDKGFWTFLERLQAGK